MSDAPVLEITDLRKYFRQNRGLVDSILGRGQRIQAVDGVSLSLDRGESQGLIGESGCGKSTLLMTMLGLLEPTSGTIRYKGVDVSTFDRKQWKAFRRNVQPVFQDPFNSLDPKQTVREALTEPLTIHDISDTEERIVETLEQVELRPPEKYLDRLPRSLSGGEKQRVSIARALVLEPEILLADEPVSMLDVSTQAAILQDLEEIVTENAVSMLYISHDLSTVSYICDVVNVMYLGRIVESAPTKELLNDPAHPYTQALISAIPIPDPFYEREFTELHGRPGNAANLEEGCRFKDRCPERMDICDVTPEYVHRGSVQDHHVACHLYYDHKEPESTKAIEGSEP